LVVNHSASALIQGLNHPPIDPLLDETIIPEINWRQQLASYQRLAGNEELAYSNFEKADELCSILRAQIMNQLAHLDKNIQGNNPLRSLEQVNELVPLSYLSQLQLVNELISCGVWWKP